MKNATKKVAIEVKNIHKEFILINNKSSTLKQAAINIVNKNKKTVYKVLDGVSFNVNVGDFFGIIGRNGSGKSTLLKLIAGVYEPTAGNIYTYGGLTPFIELGVGFNAELSGRDNVFLNGAMLGFTRKQMSAMYDEIVAFAELEPFMDQKLKNYSSGMQVRLAFSIAIKAENDILIFDEVLAVGDANFQEKCIRQFYDLKRKGKTIILVTHSMDMVEKFCNKAVVIKDGKIKYCGSARSAIDMYENINLNTSKLAQEEINSDAVIKSLIIENSKGIKTKLINDRESFFVNIDIFSKIDIDNIFIAVRLCESENQFPIIAFDSDIDNSKIDLKKGNNNIKIEITNNSIKSGKYYAVIGVYGDKSRFPNICRYEGINNDNFFIIGGEKNPGIIHTDRKWIISND